MKKKLALALAIIFFGFTAGMYLLQEKEVTTSLQSNVPYLAAAIISVISGLAALKIFHLSSKEGVVLALLTAGLACFTLGELIFFYFQYIAETDPFPSVADVFFILGYPLIFWALVKEVKHNKVSWRDFSKKMLALIILFCLALTAFVAYFGIYLAYDADATLIENVVAMAYPVGDLILIVPIFLILKVAVDFKGGKLFYSWMMIFIALLGLLAGDILFAIFYDQYSEAIFPYTLIDFTWVAMYLLFAYSFYFTTQTIRQLQSTLRKAKPVESVAAPKPKV